MRRALVLLCLLAVAAVARAEDDSAARADAAVRERITRERVEVQAGFARRQRECAERFAVTACIDAARSEQRAALARLRDQELGLDEAQRRQRAFERLQLIEEKKREDAARAAAVSARATAGAPALPASASAAAPAAPAAGAAVKRKPARPQPTLRTAKPAKTQPDRSAQEARNRDAFEARQQAAKARREAAQLREAERAKQKAPAPGLPLPASGAAR
jgi:hypothetical protein